MTWASLYHLAHSLGIHRLDFVRQRLQLLGLLERVARLPGEWTKSFSCFH